MDGLVNALKRFSLAPNYAKWSASFSKLVVQVTTRNGTPGGTNLTVHERIALLRKLDPYIKHPKFINTDDLEILQAKEDLLSLWEYLLEFVVVSRKTAVKELGYALIVLLMQREEFSLKNLGMGPRSQRPVCSPAHLRLAHKYKILLLETFVLVMKSMSQKGKFAEIIHFSAQTLAIFFFRLPLVGGRIVDALQKKALAQQKASSENGTASDSKVPSDVTVPKNGLDRHKEMNNDKTVSEFIISNPDLFQWNYFNSEAEAAALTPNMLGDDNACLVWLSTKETFFLTFVEVLVVHVEAVSTKPVSWDVIPAYNLILDCFWPLLRSAIWWDGICKRKTSEGNGWVTSLPAYMRVKRSALALLSNKTLVNHFIKLTYECTNAHSLLSVDSCVEHLNLWFSTVAYSSTAREGITNHNQNSRNTPPKQTIVDDPSNPGKKVERPTLPADFSYENYWFGMKILLKSDLFQVLLKVCSLLYNTFHLFNGQLRIGFINDLMTHSFFDLFLHWSSEVRTYFQLTLVYKVLRADRRNLPCFTDAQVIREYGVQAPGESTSRPILQRRFSFGDKNGLNGGGDAFAVPPNVYSGESSFERRMAVFDESNSTDNEELLIDIMECSKVDSYIRMCLDKDPSIPEKNRPYIDQSLKQYAHLLKQYYRGVMTDSTETLPLLSHRMIQSESNPHSVA